MFLAGHDSFWFEIALILFFVQFKMNNTKNMLQITFCTGQKEEMGKVNKITTNSNAVFLFSNYVS